ncbi:hypothetical protein LT85_4095 [Collimonas arenae]|uniref:T6SS Phospholipase effector Tle1-like catalytic domain-containing protein n=1 Tax=Collimonas arenae TaxID=279058 RepID=A0A0A1FEU4_9BURK|nr:DUF2235 domain-containing protein [Collimonas arenae]AIY43253.1 hypothetical protein LT85_4095 [Collimonas arenae]
MIEELTFAVAPTRQAPAQGITMVVPKHHLDFGKCEENLHVGLFFDGTNNNRDEDKPKLGHSNIVRLSDAYPQEPADGLYRIYVPGVGTPFIEIGEMGHSTFGNGFGLGCESRIIFGLLAIFNSIHQRAYDDQKLFNAAQVKALCRNGPGEPLESDQKPLEALGIKYGLLMPDAAEGYRRQDFLEKQSKLLEKKLAAHGKPDIKECFVDVFGFSRGAAQARVFCQWLDQLLSDGKLAGITVRLRFVGLMDTVASAGILSGIFGAITNSTDGHKGWAVPKNLLIPASVENCVHMVAMHELRKNFPLDELGVNGILPPHCQEFAYPGAHSDVGGGYLPEELGISVGKTPAESDALKLAQIPLNHMLECALAAGVPLNKKLAISDSGHDPFIIDPRVEQAFNNFLTASTMVPRQMHNWLQPYLTWRWQVCKSYEQLHQVQKANAEDRKLLIDANKKLVRDAELIAFKGDASRSRRFLDYVKGTPGASLKEHEYRQSELSSLDQEAPAVVDIAQKAPPTPEPLAVLFDDYIHDSYAGFTKSLVEPTGYWRYRKGFRGNGEVTIVRNEVKDPNRTEQVASNDAIDQNTARG